MIPKRRRWWFPALLLFLALTAACRQTPQLPDTPVPVSPGVSRPYPSEPDSAPIPSLTPEPVVSFRGISLTFDEQLLGPIGSFSHAGPIPPGVLPPQPEHLRIDLSDGSTGDVPALYIFPVQQYVAISPEAAAEIATLESLLEERPAEVRADLPLLPTYTAVQSYHSQPNYLDFRNGSGISFMVRADHDHSLITEEAFFYTFQGLTDDGRFYVAAFVPLTGAIDTDGQADSVASADRRAKVAGAGNWIGVEVGNGHSLVDDMMMSLEIRPDEGFPSIVLPDFYTRDGLFLGYDLSISGEATSELVPTVVDNPQGESEYLPGLPDSIKVTFGATEEGFSPPTLEVQPIRDETGAFFETIPAWQRENVQALEEQRPNALGHLQAGEMGLNIKEAVLQNGSGMRWIQENVAGQSSDEAGAGAAYHFQGVSEDGRYLVRLQHSLPPAMARQAGLDYLDSLVHSVLVAPNASTTSSVPSSPPDCEKEVQFVADVSVPDYTVIDGGETFVKIWRVRNAGTCTWTPDFGLAYAQGNPLQWEQLALTSVVSPGDEVEVGISVESPLQPGIYEAWWQLADARQEPFGALLGLIFESPEPATDIPGYGVIEGEIRYPANGNPAVDIYFLRTDGSERYSMRTERGWTRFSNSVPAGAYYVFARVAGDSSGSGGGYTRAVVCGLHAACDDHSLVEVLVEEGRANRSAIISDWYAPAGTFPFPEPAPMPSPDNSDDS